MSLFLPRSALRLSPTETNQKQARKNHQPGDVVWNIIIVSEPWNVPDIWMSDLRGGDDGNPSDDLGLVGHLLHGTQDLHAGLGRVRADLIA